MRIHLAICALVCASMLGCNSQPADRAKDAGKDAQKTADKGKSAADQKDTDKKDKSDAEQPDKGIVNGKPDESKDKLAVEPPAPATKANPLQVLDFDGIQKLIAAHKGKVVVMDAWATYCPPCLRDFHHLVDLHKKYGPEKVACVSLSFDYGDGATIDELKPKVQKFLDLQGATFDNIISSEDYDTLYRKFDLTAIPAVLVYGKDGKLIAMVEESGDDEKPIYDRVKALVEKNAGKEAS